MNIKFYKLYIIIVNEKYTKGVINIMEYKLIAIDMDGTMLNSEHEISQQNIDAVEHAIESGVNVVISTGRSGVALKKYMESFNFTTPFIVYNGAGIKYLDKPEYMVRYDLDFEIATKICDKARELGTSALVWADDSLYAIGTTDYTKYYTFHSGTPCIEVDIIDDLKGKGIHKVMFVDDPVLIREYYGKIIEEGFNETNFTISIPKILEFFSLEASKGKAVLNYAKSLNIKQEEIICIGDGMNDITMIEMAGLGVAMDNACDELKCVADFVTKSNDDNGVAYAINKFVLGNEN